MDAPPDEDAMAQAMGFSSFGSQARPQKKRKYNPHADAVVGDSAAPHIPDETSATGSNSTPLGSAPRVPAYANHDEIGLDDEDGDGNENVHSSVTASQNTVSTAAAPSSDPTQVRPAGLPNRPIAGASFSGSLNSQHRGQKSNKSQNPLWYEGYYDPTSNENPWKLLEESEGLHPIGPWLSRGKQSIAPA